MFKKIPNGVYLIVVGVALLLGVIGIIIYITRIDSTQIDKLSKIVNVITAFVTTIVVSIAGAVFGWTYRKRELDIAQANTVQKIFETLQNTDTHDDNQIQAALFTISTLGDPRFAVQLAELWATQKSGAIYALERFASNSDEKISRLAKSALENIMDKPHIWKDKTIKVLDKARAFQLIDDIVMERRRYSDPEILDIFEEACKFDRALKNPQKRFNQVVIDELGQCLNIYRMGAIYRLLNLFPREKPYSVYRIYRFINKWPELRIRREFERMIPLFKAIVKINRVNEKSQTLHRDYAHLAYVYKDSVYPRWPKVKENIGFAIETLDNAKDELPSDKYKRFKVIYDLNDLLCDINVEKDEDAILRRLHKYRALEIGDEEDENNQHIKALITTHLILKPGLENLKGKPLALIEKWENLIRGKQKGKTRQQREPQED